MIIAFDVDITLVNEDNTPNYNTIKILHWFQRNGDRIIVWSGGGADYARWCGEKLGLKADFYLLKCKQNADQHNVDLTFDDETITLGKLNYKICQK